MISKQNWIWIGIELLLLFVMLCFSEKPKIIEESFDTKCVDKNIIQMVEILVDQLDENTKIELIRQKIKWTGEQSGIIMPILNKTDPKTKKPITDKEKVELLKKALVKHYIIKCKYNASQKISDIKYLHLTNPEINEILNDKTMMDTSKIIEISQLV